MSQTKAQLIDNLVQPITGAAGSASAPTFSFTADPNTGIYSPGADQVAVATNGTTSSPSTPLEVAGAVGSGVISDYLSLYYPQSYGGGGSGPRMLFKANDIAGTKSTYAGIWSLLHANTVGAHSGKLVFGTTSGGNLVERLRIDESGNVGIGTTSPQRKLVVSEGGAQGFEFYPGDTGGGNTLNHYNRSGGGNFVNSTVNADQHIFGRADGEAVRIDSSKRLLVGTSSAAGNHLLQIVGVAGSANNYAGLSLRREYTPLVNLGDTSPVGMINFEYTGGGVGARIAAYCDVNNGIATDDYPTRLVFFTTADGASSPTERMRIGSVGFLKASDNGTYHAAGGSYHEFRQSISNSASLVVTASNGSYVGNLIHASTVRAATNAFSLLKLETSTFSDAEFNLAGDGNAFADGSWNGGGADYAEYFEWSDANPDEEDRRGISVVLDGDKIREAQAGEDPIGVISGNPSVVGDAAWNKWSGKYLRDEFGTYIQEDYEVTDDDGNTVTQQRRKLNPAYNPDVEYISREQRPEWDCVGLMGKLRIRKGQVTGSRWIKMRDISDSVEEWLVR
jgi:hypothetical protein